MISYKYTMIKASEVIELMEKIKEINGDIKLNLWFMQSFSPGLNGDEELPLRTPEEVESTAALLRGDNEGYIKGI